MELQTLLAVLAITWTLATPSARAQDQPGNSQPADSQPGSPLPPQEDANDRPTPVAAARGLFLSSNSQDQTAGQIQPDDHPLSGAVTPGLGSTQGRRLFDPSFRLTEAVDYGTGVTNSLTSIGGSLAFAQNWQRYQLTAAYSGAQVFYTPHSSLTRAYHNLAVTQGIHWNRWNLLLVEDVSLSPESSFGGLFTSAPGLPGQNATLSNVTPALQSSDTILTGRTTQLNNTTVAEIDYSLTRRTTLTVSGSYGVLHFSKPGYVGSRSVDARGGYEYALSARNSLALIYTFSATRFSGLSVRQENHLAQVGFGRKVTGRLSFQLSGGPQLTVFQNFSLAKSRRWSWGLSGSLNYQMSRNTGYNFAYFHGITAGSGVYVGSASDTFTGSVSHRFTRFWSASLNTGYARNTSLVPAIGVSSRYDNWFGGATLSRQIGREIRINGVYAYQRQYNSAGQCPVLTCGIPGGGSRSLASVTLEWHPFAIQNE